MTVIQDILANKEDWAQKSPEEVLKSLVTVLPKQFIHANSLGLEDVVIAHMLSEIAPGFASFTLDTGRLPPESLKFLERLESRLGIRITVMFPKHEAIEDMINKHGINLFYDSIENRKLCCQVRKVEPLQRALSGFDAWVCGLRHSQSATRESLGVVECDSANGNKLKVSPLINWSLDDVKAYIKKHSLPYNPLFDQGYLSIGCAPCSRPVNDGDDERAGRWWWENADQKECGLHRK